MEKNFLMMKPPKQESNWLAISSFFKIVRLEICKERRSLTNFLTVILLQMAVFITAAFVIPKLKMINFGTINGVLNVLLAKMQ